MRGIVRCNLALAVIFSLQVKGIQAECESRGDRTKNNNDEYLKQNKILSPPRSHKKQQEQEQWNQDVESPDTERPRKKCCPYDFDSRICRTVGDRVVCGYNRNQGNIDCREKIKELGEGCRLRKGRVECGYVQPPYIYIRRPKANENHGKSPIRDMLPLDTPDIKPLQPDTAKVVPEHEENDDYLKNELDGDAKLSSESNGGKKICLEIKDRIVCRDD